MIIFVPDETVLFMFTKFMKLGVVGAAVVGGQVEGWVGSGELGRKGKERGVIQ